MAFDHNTPEITKDGLVASTYEEIQAMTHRVMYLSVKHLSDNAIGLLNSDYFANKTGFAIHSMTDTTGLVTGYCVDTKGQLGKIEIADDIRAALAFAADNDCDIVIFNDDVRPIPDLDVF